MHPIAAKGEVRRRVGAGQVQVDNVCALRNLKSATGCTRWRKALRRSSGEPDPGQVQIVLATEVFDGAVERVLVQVSASRCS